MSRTAGRLLATLGIIAILVALPLTGARAQTSRDWPMYLNNAARTGYAGAEKAITRSTAHKLRMLWTDHVDGAISAQPIQVGGVVYYGSWDGYERAVNAATDTHRWSAFVGQTTNTNCDPPTLGVASTATVATITVRGTATRALFVGGGNGNFYALNASNGRVIWKTPLDTQPNGFLFSSPLLYHGSIYEGIASCGNSHVRGGIAQLNAVTGKVQHILYTAPRGCNGASVWGSPAVDTATRDLYFATGNAQPCKEREKLSVSVIQTNASLKILSSWQVPAKLQPNNDSDFGSTPTLFTASIRGVIHKMLGIPNKNGIYFAFDRSAVSRGPLWMNRVASPGGNCPQCGGTDGADISPSAYDGHHLFIGSEMTRIRGRTCAGSLREVQPSTGRVVWADCLQSGPVLGAVTAVPGVAFVTAGNTVYAVGTSKGTILWKFQDTNGGSWGGFWGAPTISNGRLFAGHQNGRLYAFGF
jgi:polyvinyl alcohol dehydrogenase (cytochrome)